VALLRRFGFATLAGCLLMGLVRSATAEQTALLLDVRINGYAIGAVGQFVLRDGVLLARAGELGDLGFLLPGPLAAGPDTLVSLSDLPGLVWKLEPSTQTLSVSVGNEWLKPQRLDTGTGSKVEAAVESGLGVTLNYEVDSSNAGGRDVTNGQFDLRAFSPWGVVNTGLLATSGAAYASPDAKAVVRLDSTYTYSDAAKLQRYRLGDFISGGLAWTRPIRLGGVQFSSDFGLRPDLVTFPLPSASASAAVPSTLEVLVNGTRLFSRDLNAGPFEIPQLPVVTGAGTISLALTNALGRQVILTLPFYASSALLAPGLQTFSLQAGALRRNWSRLSNDYGALVASASLRRGLSPKLTVEGSVEATASTLMAGAGLVLNAFDAAVLNLSAAGSSGAGLSGSTLTAGVQRISSSLSLALSATVASGNFRDIAAVTGDAVPRRRIAASAGLSLGRHGSLGLAYVGIDRSSPARATDFFGGVVDRPTNLNAHILSASYSVQWGRVSLFATGFRDAAGAHAKGLLLGLSMPLDRRSSVGISSASGSGGAHRQLQAQQSPASEGDWGYQAYAADGAVPHQFAQLQYRSPWALLSVGVDRNDGQTSQALRAEGALSFVDGALFASNSIADAFAVVDTNGLGGIRVLRENREIGRTDAEGRLLVPDLRAFDVNRIAIEPIDVPQDTTILVTTRELRPQDRSGVIVKFAVKVSRGALVKLVDDAGVPVPPGSSATLKSSGAAVPVGYDGAAYVEDLAPHNVLMVVVGDGRHCQVSFDYRPVKGEIPVIGPLSCRTSP